MKGLLWVLAASTVAWAGYWGRYVPFSEQWPLYEALRTTASIIFAVVGAWFAIIYPERLKLSFRGESGLPSPASDSGINRLFTPIVHSTAILSLILAIGVVAPLAKHWEFVGNHSEIWRSISYSLLVALTLWQLVTVLYSLVGPDILKTHSDDEQDEAEQLGEFTKLQPKRTRKSPSDGG